MIHISVARYHRTLPQPGEALEFLVAVHEEGTGITWQQNVTVDAATEEFLADATHSLHLRSMGLALTPKKAADLVHRFGTRLSMPEDFPVCCVSSSGVCSMPSQ